ncbi:hypothetical protein ACVXHB_05545 [Escherichia coli]
MSTSSPDVEFMAQVEERLGSCLPEEQRRYLMEWIVRQVLT